MPPKNDITTEQPCHSKATVLQRITTMKGSVDHRLMHYMIAVMHSMRRMVMMQRVFPAPRRICYG
ncbi:hypothetical protein EAE96_006900 [Botrytis aclada]|nr:hypothetical protein EAE96_006900 [Botrytis aclada]